MSEPRSNMIIRCGKKYLCFSTPVGNFKFLRMPLGISSAPEIFQRAMHHILQGCDGSLVYLDDILTSINRISEYTEGYSFNDFKKDFKTVDAVINYLKSIHSGGTKRRSRRAR